MLSRTSKYALRALIHLAQRTDQWPIPGNAIAEEAGIPSKYLSAILSELVRKGVLESARGKSGGFSMVRTPEQVNLMEVLTPFERFEDRDCPFGNDLCSEEDPCTAHEDWRKVVQAEQHFLSKTSVADIASKTKGSAQRN